MKKARKMTKGPGGRKEGGDKVPTLTKSKSRYEFSAKITGSDTGKIDPTKHTDKM